MTEGGKLALAAAALWLWLRSRRLERYVWQSSVIAGVPLNVPRWVASGYAPPKYTSAVVTWFEADGAGELTSTPIDWATFWTRGYRGPER